jgi:hypothetical protein
VRCNRNVPHLTLLSVLCTRPRVCDGTSWYLVLAIVKGRPMLRKEDISGRGLLFPFFKWSIFPVLGDGVARILCSSVARSCISPSQYCNMSATVTYLLRITSFMMLHKPASVLCSVCLTSGSHIMCSRDTCWVCRLVVYRSAPCVTAGGQIKWLAEGWTI